MNILQLPIRTCILATLTLLISGCTTAQPVNVQAELDTWVGHDADRLVRSWGAPDRSYDFKDGNRVMEYEKNRVDTYSGWNRPYGGISVGSRGSTFGVGVPIWEDEPRISVRRCTMKFETDKKRVIRRTSFIGSNCAYALKNSITRR